MPPACRSRSWCATNGSPTIWISDFGTFSVSAPKRVAKPPASIATGSIGPLGMRQNGSSAEIELQANLAEPGPSHGRADSDFVFRVEEQKSSAAGADEFATERSVRARQLVHLVDKTAAHPRRTFFLVLPMNMHQVGKLAQIAGQQSVSAFVPQLFSEVQILQHLGSILPGPHILIAQSFGSNFQGFCDDMVIGHKFETGDATEGRNVLILLADRFF